MDRSLEGLRQLGSRLLGGVLSVVLAAVLLTACSSPRPEGSSALPPSQYQSGWWTGQLGGDQPVGAAQIGVLNDLAHSDLSPGNAKLLAELGRVAGLAEFQGSGRESFAGYFSTSAPALCTGVSVTSSSPVVLPVNTPGGINTTNWAKILVTYTGRCQGSALRANDVQAAYFYAVLNGGWELVHEYQVPGSSNVDPVGVDASPASWQMQHFSNCGSPGNREFQDLIVVVAAFEVMCRDAQAQGVHLVVASAYRTRAEQAALFSRAVSVYGSEAKARQYVAFADGAVCTSRHCAGAALDLSSDHGGLAWAHAVVGCLAGHTISLGTKSCPRGATPIQRLERYGFAAPAVQIPEYLEFVLATSSAPQNCSPPPATSVATKVASIWRCRLQLAGVSPAETRRVVAAAEVVSLCESGWNPAARAYGGTWSTTPNPVDGKTYTNQGVFMISAHQAARFAPPGASMLEPVANINAAANLWLATRSFAAFGCATGHGSFDHGPVLTEYGGPPLPTWAYSY